MMWVLLLLLLVAPAEPVIFADTVNKLILRNGKNPCEGHVEIYRHGQLGYLGDKFWSAENEDVVCRSTHCGSRRSSTDTVRPIGSNVWLNEIKCKGTEKHLFECKCPGWAISKSRKATVKKITCSNTIKIRLDGPKCAGAVQYSTDGQTYSGYFCADNWGRQEANLLCKNLGCGTYREIVEEEWLAWKEFKTSEKMQIQCSDIGNVTNLWQCATLPQSPLCKGPASVICTGHKRLQLRGNDSNACSGLLEEEEQDKWAPVTDNRTSSPAALCQQMHCGTDGNYSRDESRLNCTDTVEVVLMDSMQESTCYGSVHIKVNGETRPVCASTWTAREAMVVCRELNCGNVISIGTRPAAAGMLDNVKCSGRESSLWHCRAKRDTKPFPCSSSAYVVCSGSVNSRLIDGPGRCAGRVEIHYEGRWQSVDNKKWKDALSDIVCTQHDCGKNRKSGSRKNSEKFSRGSGDFLSVTINCPKSTSNISECSMSSTKKPPAEKEAVEVTCEEHKVLFLEDTCAGRVGIQQDTKAYWLSWSEETWNQTSADAVCRQMECGKASSFNSSLISSADKIKAVWGESYTCSSNVTSLFDCKRSTIPSGHSNTVATVICSDKITVNLTRRCWGTVSVCVGGRCGGVSKDTWTEEKSVMLCKELGCGETALPPTQLAKLTDLTLKSLHTTNQTTKLAQCNMVKYGENETSRYGHAVRVVCSGSVEARISSPVDKCGGNVELSYEDQWLPVCRDALDTNIQNAICEELSCGQADKVVGYTGQTPKGPFISRIQCPTARKTPLRECSFSLGTCALGGIKCSRWRTLELPGACHGAVFVRSEGRRSAVSSEGWTQADGERLCHQLNCGRLLSNKTITLTSSLSNTALSCAGVRNPESIWDCERSNSTLSSKKQLYIDCQDDAKVTLSGKCAGKVKLNNIGVCSNGWSKDHSDMVCQEQNCSNAITHSASREEAVGYALSCDMHHYKLGQCKRYQQKCKEMSVFCVGNIEFNTTEKCGGQIEVRYKDEFKKVCPLAREFNSAFKEKLCEELKCGSYNRSLKGDYREKASMDMQISCSPDHMDIKHCVSQKSCTKDRPAEIYCNGYERKLDNGTESTQTSPVFIVVGAGFLLVLVIAIAVFVRRDIVKKAKMPMNASYAEGTLSRSEGEFESGNYEEVMSKANEMEDLRRGRFRADAEFITGNDAHSTSSFPYDDVEEAVESQPLTSQASDGASSGDNYIQEGVLDQRGDVVTYEVEDPQDSYDDIEAGPETTQTEAEVRGGLQTAPEGVAAAPLGLEPGEEDYLVPGLDG